MVKRRFVIGAAALAAACTGVGILPTSSTSEPSASSAVTPTVHGTGATPCPTPSPSPSPAFAVFGQPTHATGVCGSLNAAFKVNPDPPTGGQPLDVTFNMCKSFDTDPTLTLVYNVQFGDGGAGGGGCSITHTYNNKGTYFAQACVGGEGVGSVCQNYTVTVGDSCDVTLSFPQGSPSGKNTCLVTVNATTAGNGACGNPLTVGLSIHFFFPASTFNQGSSVTCPPGQTCTVGFQVPNGSFGTGIIVPADAKGNSQQFCISGCQVGTLNSCG